MSMNLSVTLATSCCLIFTASAATRADVVTSFEFTDLSGQFVLGTSPRSVEITGGVARSVGVPGLYHSGMNAWLLRREIGTMTFESPAESLELFFRNQNVETDALVQLLDAEGNVLKSVVVVSNEGNVTESLRDLALVYFQEERWVGRSAVYALRDAAADDGLQACLDRVIKELKDTIAKPARITILNEVSPVTRAPPPSLPAVAFHMRATHSQTAGARSCMIAAGVGSWEK